VKFRARYESGGGIAAIRDDGAAYKRFYRAAKRNSREGGAVAFDLALTF
jgi:hypothetical protein